MRTLALLVLLAMAARADDDRTVRDAAGRVEVTVPPSWEDQALEGSEVIHLYAARSGGHVLTIIREAGQAEVDKQRDRYMAYDAGNYPGAEFSKIADPFFGYRMNDQVKNRVYLRAFLKDGADGIVATISSRFHGYDRAYAEKTVAVLASLRLASGDAPAETVETEGARRIFDKAGLFSFAAPAIWKTITPDEGEILALGHKGSSSTATLRVVPEGENDNPTLILITLQGQMKRDYATCSTERVGTEPPAMIVKGRKEGWVDYLIAFAAGGRGYTLRLAAREGAFDGFRPVADAMAGSLALMGDPYREPDSLPGEVTREHKKGYVVHAAAEQAEAADRVLAELNGFDKDWGKIAPASARKGVLLHILVTRRGAFADASHGFGEMPAAYDRLACAVVVVPPSSGKEEEARWRGRLYAALAAGALHRDLDVAAPPWLLAGLTACMDAAGRSGGGPDARHYALVAPLEAADPAPLADVFKYAYSDVIQGETLTPLAMSWGYAHLMLFGRGTIRGLYVKWARELAKATRTAPELDVSRVDAQAELKKHIERELKK